MSVLDGDIQYSLMKLFADELVEDVGENLIDGCAFLEQRTALLPSMLRYFAVLKTSQASNRLQHKALAFIRYSRKAIARTVATRSANPRATLPLAENNAMSAADRIAMLWNRESNSDNRPDDLAENIEDLPTGLAIESTQDALDAKAFLLRGPEYTWLVNKWKLALSTGSSCRSLFSVHESFFRQVDRNIRDVNQRLPESKRTSLFGSGNYNHARIAGSALTLDQTNTQTLSTLVLYIEWNPISYLETQFGSHAYLGESLVIVGDEEEPFATTCEEYLTMIWPNTGAWVLEQFQDLVARPSKPLYTKRQGIEGTRMTLKQDLPGLHIWAQGSALELVEIFEIVVWLGTACRASSSDDAKITKCEPQISITDGKPLSFRVSFQETVLSHDKELDQASRCWHNLFRNATIATGFPVPLRTDHEYGLEMSADLMMFMAQTHLIVHYNDHVLLKGYNTILAPSARTGDSVQWHFLVDKDRKRLSYNEGVLHSALRFYEEALFPTARHIIGWSDVEVIAGKRHKAYSGEIQI